MIHNHSYSFANIGIQNTNTEMDFGPSHIPDLVYASGRTFDNGWFRIAGVPKRLNCNLSSA